MSDAPELAVRCSNCDEVAFVTTDSRLAMGTVTKCAACTPLAVQEWFSPELETETVDPNKSEGRSFAIRHAYISTYCLHHQHHRCRLFCKLCGSNCLCHCHLEEAAPSEPSP